MEREAVLFWLRGIVDSGVTRWQSRLLFELLEAEYTKGGGRPSSTHAFRKLQSLDIGHVQVE